MAQTLAERNKQLALKGPCAEPSERNALGGGARRPDPVRTPDGQDETGNVTGVLPLPAQAVCGR